MSVTHSRNIRCITKSTEKVIDRRLEFSRWYFSVCTAALIAIATLSSWAVTRPGFVLPAIVMDALFAFIGAFFCTLWSGQVANSKLLNNAKFEVLNAMAPKVKFANDAVSANPFEKEWRLLESQRATSVAGKIVVLRASYIETLLPKAIRAIFIAILLASLAIGFFNWPTISGAMLTLPTATPKS